MSADAGFTDLRLNRQEGQNQESFWPSFTDIMTVILMIFMIAMVVLLLRNIELVRQLRSTMAAEREAMELARSTGAEKETLSMKLIVAEDELSSLRIQRTRLSEENARLSKIRAQQQSELLARSDQLARLQVDQELLRATRDRLASEKRSLDRRLNHSESLNSTLRQTERQLREKLTLANQASSELRQEVDSLHTQQLETQNQLVTLHQRYSQQAESLRLARVAERRSDQQLSQLRDEYSALNLKYNELFRPARSPKGRFLVEVRYSRRGDSPLIEMASAGRQFEQVSRAEMERRLTELKASQPDGLYIKVIFPENSGLAYNEAWKFTSDLHARFDYYSQDATRPAPVAPKTGE